VDDDLAESVGTARNGRQSGRAVVLTGGDGLGDDDVREDVVVEGEAGGWSGNGGWRETDVGMDLSKDPDDFPSTAVVEDTDGAVEDGVDTDEDAKDSAGDKAAEAA